MLTTVDVVEKIYTLRERDARDELPMALSMGLASGELDLKQVEPGVYEAFSHNFGFIVDELEVSGIKFDAWFDSADSPHQWGASNVTCDNVDQAKKHWQSHVDDPQKEFVLVLSPVHCSPENAGQGRGFRWSKWGPYIGTQEIKHEFLDDEVGIDKVFLASIIQVTRESE